MARSLLSVAVATAIASMALAPGAITLAPRPAAAATAVSVASLAAANIGNGAGDCSTVNSSANSLGGSEFEGSCTGYHGGPEFWCADFVKWVWQNSDGGAIDVSGLNAAAASFYRYGIGNGTLHTSPAYQPQVGDAVVYGYNYDGAGDAEHVGLVISVSGGGVTTVNGDWDGTLGQGMTTFAETARVRTTTLDAGDSAVGSAPVSMNGMTISAYVTPVPNSSAAPSHPIDWNNTSYTTTCNGWTEQPVTVAVRNGTGKKVISAQPIESSIELQIIGIAQGDITGGGSRQTAVLLLCLPSPTNFFVTEIQLFSAAGRPLGTPLYAPDLIANGYPPYFDGHPFTFSNGTLSTGAGYYPSCHACGIVQYLLTWKWNGSELKLQSATKVSDQPPPLIGH